MRIALMFVGQPRYVTDDKLLRQWEQVIDIARKAGHEIDVHAFWWDSISNTIPTSDYKKFVELTHLTQEGYDALDRIKDRIEFTTRVITSATEMDVIAPLFHANPFIMGKRILADDPSTLYATMGQWYALSAAINNARARKEYDFYVKLRWDLIVDEYLLIHMMNSAGPTHVMVNDISINKGVPHASDLVIGIPSETIDKFDNLVPGMAACINALFCTDKMPLSIQEAALYTYLHKLHIATSPIYANIWVSRGELNSDDWRWPNYLHVEE